MGMFDTTGKRAALADRKETQDEVVVRTGFGAFMCKKFACPMPENYAWEVDTFEKLQRAVGTFDDPADRRRFFEAGDNQIAGVGYIFQSDHSVSSAVSGTTYDYIVRLVREYGVYPIRLGVA